jgi:asparagine synthase (glutamine-hydrolysing)
MCGIAGVVGTSPLIAEATWGELSSMTYALAHRGPDDEGVWLDAAAGVGLCHRRLAIIDTSPLGRQPMKSVSDRFVITFNGEIYNFRELHAQLAAAGHRFRGGSDTEVLLASIEEWGVLGALQRSVGMFAFAVWDQRERTLWLARDRFGEKPLYYAQFGASVRDSERSGPQVVFASELKALRRHGAWNDDVDRNSVALFLRHGFIPAPHSIFKRVRKVPPGCALEVRVTDGAFSVREHNYWHLMTDRAGGALPDQNEIPLVLDRVHDALLKAIRRQMVADVPLGAFLSGGIDSSLVVALMQQSSSRPVRTFTLGFDAEEFNEAPHARRVAAHLGTQHTEHIVTPAETLEVIPRLARIYDEPFADSSQIPTFLICALARREVTVALTGDAGDELFGGYSRYLEALGKWRKMQTTPPALRSRAARALGVMPLWALGAVASSAWVASRMRGRRRVPDRIRERAYVWGASSLPELYRAMMSYWQPPAQYVIGATEPGLPAHAECMDGIAHMMYADTCEYLPDDILVKVDRAAMSVSLETRVPLLDVGVAEVAWRIPTHVHLRDGRGKWVLRELLARYLPREMFERPKQGFAIPIASWLRHELKDWAAELLDPVRLRREGYFEVEPVQRRWRQHLSGAMNWSAHLWAILMFQSWLGELQG